MLKSNYMSIELENKEIVKIVVIRVRLVGDIKSDLMFYKPYQPSKKIVEVTLDIQM